MKKPFIIIESPYSGDVKRNTQYARVCLLDSIRRGESPFASHLLYTQVLDDKRKDQRKLGVETGLNLTRYADKVVVYEDYGISSGMEMGIEEAKKYNKPVEYRKIK